MGRKKMGAHRASWIVTHGEIPPGRWVLHHCDNPPCINPAHLYLGGPADNVRDRVARNRSYRGPKRSGILRGEASPNAKLTAAAAREIRRRYNAGGITQLAIAREYGVAQTTIGDVIGRRRWAHIA
jgi:hypothetical protein